MDNGTMDNGLWTMDYGLWTVDCGLWTVDCGLWTVDYGLWTTVELCTLIVSGQTNDDSTDYKRHQTTYYS